MIDQSLAISVVIPTFRRPLLLRRCLLGLLSQTLAPSRFEVIVADDGPDELTKLEVLEFGEKAPFKIRYLPIVGTQGPAAARNAGWQKAQNSIVAFTDDDTIADTCWLQHGLAAFEDPSVVAAWGKIIVPLSREPTDFEWDAAQLAHAGFVTANCFCRKSLLECIGGFDERFTMAWREDTDLYFSMLDQLTKQGGEIIFFPAAQILHPVRQESWGVSIRQQKKSLFDALLYKKHRLRYQRSIKSCPLYYALAAGLLLALLGGLWGNRTLSFLALASWTGLTGLFIWQRLRHTSKRPAHICEMVVTSLIIPYLALFWRVVGAFRFKVLFF